MGKNEDGKSVKSEKGSSSRQAHSATRTPLSPPCHSSALPAGVNLNAPLHVQEPPHSHMPPTQAVYSQGVGYPHRVLLVPRVAPPENFDQGPKNLEVLNGLVVQAVNESANFNGEGLAPAASQRVDMNTTSDECVGNSNACLSRKRGNSVAILETDKESKVRVQACTIPVGEANTGSARVAGTALASKSIAGNSLRPLQPRPENSTVGATAGLPIELSANVQRMLKLERRKEANRESARRSRMKRLAEFEELMDKYMTVKSEQDELIMELEKLRTEKALLMEKLNYYEQQEQAGKPVPNLQLGVSTQVLTYCRRSKTRSLNTSEEKNEKPLEK